MKELAELQDLLFVAEMIAVWTLHFSSTYHLQITVCEIWTPLYKPVTSLTVECLFTDTEQKAFDFGRWPLNVWVHDEVKKQEWM